MRAFKAVVIKRAGNKIYFEAPRAYSMREVAGQVLDYQMKGFEPFIKPRPFGTAKPLEPLSEAR